MPSPVEIASAIAAVISAVGGAFAAVGAMRSASSARHAQQAMERSEKRAALRELVVSWNELQVELQRVVSRATELRTAYQTFFAFSGSSEHSSEKLLLKEIDEKVRSAQKSAEGVAQVSTDVTALYDAALDDINKHHARVEQSLFLVRSVREDIEREHLSIEARCAVHRDLALRRQPSAA